MVRPLRRRKTNRSEGSRGGLESSRAAHPQGCSINKKMSLRMHRAISLIYESQKLTHFIYSIGSKSEPRVENNQFTEPDFL